MIASIDIADAMLEAMAEEARAAYPEECCGVMTGIVRAGRARVTRVIAVANVAPAGQRRRFFELDPAALFHVQRGLRAARRGGGRETIIGYYHSHPGGLARPSTADLAGAIEPGRVWLVAAPQGRAGRVAMGAYLRLGHGASRRFRPLTLNVT